MHVDVLSLMPRFEDEACVNGWTLRPIGDLACERKAEEGGLVFVERYHGVGYYCAPTATKGSPSGFAWFVVVVVALALASIARWLVRRRRTSDVVD
jgi:hypothetical protein